MSKRFVFNQQHGDRKKAKLNITISDHNFPLSQNSNNKEFDQDNWGDDNDDEILLLASQACEQAYNDVSSLPDYSMCMQPGSTSTQYEPIPSTSSKTAFTFKKPSANPPSAISTHLKNKCSTISSPLPGMSTQVQSKRNEQISINDDLVFNDKVCKGQDPDFMYRKLLKLQEDNTKLKSENGKLLEKCVTKEGEASILRTQLKSCQVAVDNARMDKIKAQERVETEWTEKLSAANSVMSDLRTQLDFKNLEIISIKEKCKKLESSKLKLTQVTLGSNDISTSHRNSYFNDTTSQARRVKVSTNGVQTDNEANFLKLNKICREDTSKLSGILPLILENAVEQHHSIIDYNEKLQKHTDYSQNKCRIFSTFHRIPSTPNPSKDAGKTKVHLSHIYEDLTVIASAKEITETVQKRYFSLFGAIKSVLQDLQCELVVISQRVTNAFQKEMDERYIDATSSFLTVNRKELLQSGSLYKDEQAIFTRRTIAVATYILESPESFQTFKLFEEQSNKNECYSTLIDTIKNICSLLDSTSCAVLYSGLLLSLTMLLESFLHNTLDDKSGILEVTRIILSSRPMPFVSCYMLVLIRRMTALENCLIQFCPGSNSANLKVDYEQGVLLYKKDSCYFQVLIKQVESSLKCVETQSITDEALNISRSLIAIHSNISGSFAAGTHQTAKCDCQLMLVQVIVYSLRICAVMLKKLTGAGNTSYKQSLLAVCRSGVQTLHQCALRDLEFSSQLAYNEGHLIDLCEIVKQFDHSEIFGNMLSELTSTFQASPEETTSSFHRQPWLKSFESFSLTD